MLYFGDLHANAVSEAVWRTRARAEVGRVSKAERYVAQPISNMNLALCDETKRRDTWRDCSAAEDNYESSRARS